MTPNHASLGAGKDAKKQDHSSLKDGKHRTVANTGLAMSVCGFPPAQIVVFQTPLSNDYSVGWRTAQGTSGLAVFIRGLI